MRSVTKAAAFTDKLWPLSCMSGRTFLNMTEGSVSRQSTAPAISIRNRFAIAAAIAS